MKTLDIDECAEFLKIHRITAYEMAQQGKLPGAKIGRSWVFLEEDLVEYLHRNVLQQQRERQIENASRQPPPTFGQSPGKLLASYPTIQTRRIRRNIPPKLPDDIA